MISGEDIIYALCCAGNYAHCLSLNHNAAQSGAYIDLNNKKEKNLIAAHNETHIWRNAKRSDKVEEKQERRGIDEEIDRCGMRAGHVRSSSCTTDNLRTGV